MLNERVNEWTNQPRNECMLLGQLRLSGVSSPHIRRPQRTNCEGTQVTWVQLGLRGLAETEARETEENQWV